MAFFIQSRKRITALGRIGLAAAVLAGAAAAQEREISEERRAEFEQRLADTSARLELTDEQKTELEPILVESFDKRRTLMESYGFSDGATPSLGLRQMRSLRSEAQEINEETSRKAADILTEAQMEEFALIQDENRARMRERIQASRGR